LVRSHNQTHHVLLKVTLAMNFKRAARPDDESDSDDDVGGFERSGAE
jgi:hypothetical protein